MTDPTAHIERLVVKVGEDFPLGWNDKVLTAEPRTYMDETTIVLYILRRP